MRKLNILGSKNVSAEFWKWQEWSYFDKLFFFQVFTNIIGNIIRNLLVFIAKCYLKIRLTRRHVVSKMIIHEQVAIKLQKVLRSKLLTSSLSELISAYTR